MVAHFDRPPGSAPTVEGRRAGEGPPDRRSGFERRMAAHRARSRCGRRTEVATANSPGLEVIVTEAEWQACDSPFPMLLFLRGEVSAEHKGPMAPRAMSGYGDLFNGPGQHVTADQCRRFILSCANRLLELELDVPSREALDAYRRYVLDGAPRAEFF